MAPVIKLIDNKNQLWHIIMWLCEVDHRYLLLIQNIFQYYYKIIDVYNLKAVINFFVKQIFKNSEKKWICLSKKQLLIVTIEIITCYATSVRRNIHNE